VRIHPEPGGANRGRQRRSIGPGHGSRIQGLNACAECPYRKNGLRLDEHRFCGGEYSREKNVCQIIFLQTPGALSGHAETGWRDGGDRFHRQASLYPEGDTGCTARAKAFGIGLSCKSPGVKGVVAFATVQVRVDDGVKGRPPPVFIAPVGAEQLTVLALEQDLFTLRTSFHLLSPLPLQLQSWSRGSFKSVQPFHPARRRSSAGHWHSK